MKVLIAGSFDPVTLGHTDIVRRAAALFDEVYVVIMDNPAKSGSYMFDCEERLFMLSESTECFPNVICDVWHGMLVDYMKLKGIDAIVKGARTASDFEYEKYMAEKNREFYEKAETLLLCADSKTEGISSTLIRRKICEGEDISAYVPENVLKHISKKAK